MDSLPNRNVYSTAFTLLQFLGETSAYTSIYLFCYRTFNCCVMTLTVSCIFIKLFYVDNETFFKTIPGLIMISHEYLKYLLFLIYKTDITNLLRDTISSFNHFEEKRSTTSKRYFRAFRITRNIQVIVTIVGFITVYLYFLRPIFNVDFSFLLEPWMPDLLLVDAAILLSQYYLFSISVFVVFSYDFLYLVLCIHMVLQLRFLKDEIQRQLDENTYNAKNTIESCVIYHQTLLSIYERMKVVYSIMLFFHYFVTIINTCSDLFILLGHSDLASTLIEVSSIFNLIGQFACYAFPAEQVAFEFADLSNAVYMSKWYTKNVKVQKLALFIMINSQKVNYFSGAGLVDINVDAFGSVVKKSFSFYTIIRSLVDT